MLSEVAQRADFSRIRYAQCWEDADILLEALNIQPGFTCLSIASAGDNALAMLSKGPRKVVAIDINPAQLAALELRVAAFRELRHPELLALIGSVAGHDRPELGVSASESDQCRPVAVNRSDAAARPRATR